MKIITSSLGMYILFILITFLLSSKETIAQQPGWIEQNLPQSMTGSYLADRGDDLLIFTKSNSDIVYFFDTRINVWTEADIGSQQNFQKVLGAGNTAFAYSNQYLIAAQRPHPCAVYRDGRPTIGPSQRVPASVRRVCRPPATLSVSLWASARSMASGCHLPLSFSSVAAIARTAVPMAAASISSPI